MAGLMGLDWQQQKTLLKLRGKLSFRQFMGQKAKLITAVTTILLLIPVALGLAGGSAAGYLLLEDPWPKYILGFVLIMSWFVWSVAPVMSFNVNEGLDPTRLLVYPISRRDFLAHLLLGTLLDYPTYFFLPFVVAIVVGFGIGLAFPVVLIGAFLVYLMMVVTSQMIINTVGGIVRSRRFRDISVIIGAFVGMSCWLVSTSLSEIISRYFSADMDEVIIFLASGQLFEVMKWLPPGAVAKAIEQAASGAWGGAVVWLLYAGVWVAVFAWLWWKVTYRMVTGDGFIIGGRLAEEKVKAVNTEVKTGRRIFLWDSIPADIRALALKELKLKWRIPQSRIGVIYMFLMPVFAVVFPFFFGNSDGNAAPSDFGRYVLIGGTAVYTIFIYWANATNMLGWEMSGLPTLLLSPINRHRIFIGKGLAQIMMNSLPIAILIIITMVRWPGVIAVSLIPTTLGLGLACMAVVANFSALFPYPVNMESNSAQNPFAGGGGCITGLANGTLMPGAISLVCLPAILPLGIALWRDLGWLALLGGVFTLVYGAVVFWFGTALAGRLMLQREPEILKATAQSKDEK